MEENKNTITALKKAHSHLGNVIKMAENKEYCIDILQQNLAVIGLLKSARGIAVCNYNVSERLCGS